MNKLYVWEIDEVVNGFRINIYDPVGNPIYRQNTETKLEALQEIEHNIKRAILVEENKLFRSYL